MCTLKGLWPEIFILAMTLRLCRSNCYQNAIYLGMHLLYSELILGFNKVIMALKRKC